MCISSAISVAAPSVGISTINGQEAIAHGDQGGDVVNTSGDQVFVTNSRFRI
jgi:hypothetical protein